MKAHDVYLSGYYGMQNTGDDALLYASLWGIKNFLNTEQVKISAQTDTKLPNGKIQAASIARNKRFFGQHRFQHYWNAFTSKRVIFGGGSVLSNAHDINLKLHVLRLAGGDQHAAVGIGVGPFVNTEAEQACAKLLDRLAFVGVRDAESFAVARSIAPQANVHLTFDLAPLLLCQSEYRLQEIPRRGIAVNLCPVGDFSGNSEGDLFRLKEMVQTLKTIHRATNEPIILVDLNGHHQFGDSRLHQILGEMLGKNCHWHIEQYDKNPIRVLQKLAGYKAMISMRLHGNILGYLANTPCFSLNYHSKCNGWCDVVGMPSAHRINIKEPFSDALSAQVLKGLTDCFAPPILSPHIAVRRALTNWRFSHANHYNQIFNRYSII